MHYDGRTIHTETFLVRKGAGRGQVGLKLPTKSVLFAIPPPHAQAVHQTSQMWPHGISHEGPMAKMSHESYRLRVYIQPDSWGAEGNLS